MGLDPLTFPPNSRSVRILSLHVPIVPFFHPPRGSFSSFQSYSIMDYFKQPIANFTPVSSLLIQRPRPMRMIWNTSEPSSIWYPRLPCFMVVLHFQSGSWHVFWEPLLSLIQSVIFYLLVSRVSPHSLVQTKTLLSLNRGGKGRSLLLKSLSRWEAKFGGFVLNCF